jgi:hypothetical protein
MHNCDLEMLRASSGQELHHISAVLHPTKEAAEACCAHDSTEIEDNDETLADASEEMN